MRTAIEDAVEEQPGIHFRELKRDVGCSISTLNYHLRKSDRVTDVKIRGYRRVFPVNIEQEHYSPLAAMNHPSRGKIVYAIQKEPYITSRGVADRVGLASSTVSGHLKVLSDAELVEYEKDGREKKYRSTALVRNAFSHYAAKVLEDSTDRFIELWE